MQMQSSLHNVEVFMPETSTNVHDVVIVSMDPTVSCMKRMKKTANNFLYIFFPQAEYILLFCPSNWGKIFVLSAEQIACAKLIKK